MKKILAGVLVMGMLAAATWWWTRKIDPKGRGEVRNNYLEKYDFDYLKNNYERNGDFRLEILGKIEGVENRRKEKYDFETRQFRFLSDGKWITGMINRPMVGTGQWPVRTIIMVRGYAEVGGYYSGSGSWRIADELARQWPGLATISIDFLGYGGSDGESTDVLEARFEKVVSLLDLIETVKTLPWVDQNKIGIWAHSNGGQIVLSALEVGGYDYPTVLWAPMTQKFPESVLSTIDPGSPVETEIKSFLKFYDARRYAFENYLEWIGAPVLILQGTNDEWVKVGWQEELVGKLRALGKEAELLIYPGADHNLAPSWEEGVEETKRWYNFEVNSKD